MSSLPIKSERPAEVSEQDASSLKEKQRLFENTTLVCTDRGESGIHPVDADLHSISQMLMMCPQPAAAVDRQGNYLIVNPPMRSFLQVQQSTDLSSLSSHSEITRELHQLICAKLSTCLSGSSESGTLSSGKDEASKQHHDVQLTPYFDCIGDIPVCIVMMQERPAISRSSNATNDHFDADMASKRFLSALDFFSGGFALYDQNDRKLVFNKTYADIHSFLGDDLKLGMTFQDCVRIQIQRGLVKDAIGQEEAFIARRTERFRNPTGPFEVRKPGNKWYRVTEQRLEDGGCLQTMEDISEMKLAEIALRESEQRFKEFAETAADLFWDFDEELKFSYLSFQQHEKTGESPDFAIGLDLRETQSVSPDSEEFSSLTAAYEAHEPFEDIVVCSDSGVGARRYYSFSGRPRFDEYQKFVGYRGIARDITEARKLTDQLHYQARHDSLTKLINRREFNEQVSRIQREVRSKNTPATLGFVDLDQFKIVNDTQGHPAGDRLLKELADFLVSRLRSTDMLARLGGDEFGLLLQDCNIHDGKVIVENLMSALRSFSFVSNGKVFGVTASVGLVEVNDGDASLEDLIRQVDIACYAAKDLGRNQVHVYDPGDHDVKKRSLEILHASGIQQAIAQDRFVLYAQPIAKTDSAAGVYQHYEVLLRMIDEQNNVLSPASFIPVAERYRLMTDIDRWVIQNTLKALQNLPANLEQAQFTINLSGESFTDSTLVEDIKTEFCKNNIAPQRIIFEITETAVVACVDRACQFIEQLTHFGCQFAIDDFGSGMSSFSYLKRFDVQYLKIDGSLVREIVTESDDRNMVAAINQMAHVLGMQTIAEFVENQQIADVLSDIGVDMLQGYGIGRPTPLSGVLIEQ